MLTKFTGGVGSGLRVQTVSQKLIPRTIRFFRPGQLALSLDVLAPT